MKIVTLGGTSVSGKSFISYVNSSHPHATVVDVSRAELEGSPSRLVEIAEIRERSLKILEKHRPTHIINFLGSISNHFPTDLRANVQIPEALLHAALAATPQASIVLIGSAAEYGNITDSTIAVTESHPLHPTSVYGITKAMQSLLVPFYASRFKLNVKLARTFNVLAPGLSSKLFVGRIYEQIAMIRAGQRTDIEVGPLADERDYVTADEASVDYLRILLRGIPGEVYNVCCGSPISMENLLQQILNQEGLTGAKIVQDPSIARSAVPRIFGSRSKVEALAIPQQCKSTSTI